jgi:ABC-type uncharacterized transport system fused permease/ATPase subunit
VSDEIDDKLKYAQGLYKDVLDWYRSAESKAQVLLAIDGTFLAFLTGSIFTEPDKIKRTIGWETWFLLGLMSLFLVCSIISALLCLWSRIDLLAIHIKMPNDEKPDTSKVETYESDVMWFFQKISYLKKDRFLSSILKVDKYFTIQALANESFVLSKNVSKKHFWVDLGFFFIVITLILFLSAGISYLVRSVQLAQ